MWPYEDMVAYADEKDKYIREVLYKNTDLPKYPDIKELSNLLMDCQEMIWG